MDKLLIMLTSITYAIKGKSILESYGIFASIERTPRNGGLNGCGYSLYVPKRTLEAEAILKEHNIKILGRTTRGELH